MIINKRELYKLYMQWVDNVSKEHDWKTHFGPREIVNAMADIIEKNPSLIELPSDEEIEKYFKWGYGGDSGSAIYGAKWMKEMILNQTK